MLPLNQPAVALSLLASGVFLLTGMLTGVWKYASMMRSPQGQAPAYVDIAHRASLLYSFAALVLAALAAHSAWDDWLDLWAAAGPLLFFAAAIDSYIIQGWFNRTDNQFVTPHRLGPLPMPRALLRGFMWALAIVEIGGTAVLVAGAAKTVMAVYR